MSVRFTTASDTLSIASAPSLSVITVVFFVKVSVDRNTFSTAVSLQASTANFMYSQCDLDGTTMQSVWATGGITINTSGPNMTVGTWYAFAVQRLSDTSRNQRWRVASANAFTTSSPGGTLTAPAITSVRIASGPFANQFFNGCISGVRIWEAALSLGEIERECGQVAPNRTENLWAAWPLTSVDTATEDISGNSRILTAGGSLLTGDDEPPVPFRQQRPSMLLKG
jgi:hypothetical protein